MSRSIASGSLSDAAAAAAGSSTALNRSNAAVDPALDPRCPALLHHLELCGALAAASLPRPPDVTTTLLKHAVRGAWFKATPATTETSTPLATMLACFSCSAGVDTWKKKSSEVRLVGGRRLDMMRCIPHLCKAG